MSYETFLSGFLAIFSLAALFAAKDFPGTSAHVPVIALGILCAMSALTFCRSLVRGPADGSGGRMNLMRDFNARVILTILFFLSFSYVSYRITAPLFIVLICRMSGISWKNAILGSAVASVVTYAVFIKWLQVYIEI